MRFNSLIPELSVHDLKKSKEFYTKIIGFTINYEREGFAFLSLGNAQVMLDEIGKSRTWKTGKFERPLGRGINLQIRVDKIAPLLASLSKKKNKLFLKPEEKWYSVGKVQTVNKQFLVQDPDGYLLRFFEDLGTRKA